MTREVLIQILNDQAADDGLWFVPEYNSEAYLQAELRRLHEVVENYLKEPEQPVQPVQEPVAVWELQETGWESICDGDWLMALPMGTRLYTSPPQRQPLTNEQVETIGDKVANMPLVGVVPNFRTRFARAIEAAHGIGENT